MTHYDTRYTHYQLNRSRLRKLVRRLYLNFALRQLAEPTVDFGCGIGELLQMLPEHSVGLEINPASVEHCRARGLDAHLYDADSDNWSLTVLDGRSDLRSLVVSHVLEHLNDPLYRLHRLLISCCRLGITRVLVVVPGRCGYALDPTHRTFIDAAMLTRDAVTRGTGFAVGNVRYFPGNLRILGNYFVHHELQVTYQREPARQPDAG